MYARSVAAYLSRIKLTSLLALSAICLYLAAAKAHGREALAGCLLALPNLLILFFPSSRISIVRGIALVQGLAFCSVTGFGLLLGFAIQGTGADLLLFLLLPIFLSQGALLLFAAKREPSEAAAKGGPGSPAVLFSACFALIYLAYVYLFVLQT